MEEEHDLHNMQEGEAVKAAFEAEMFDKKEEPVTTAADKPEEAKPVDETAEPQKPEADEPPKWFTDHKAEVDQLKKSLEQTHTRVSGQIGQFKAELGQFKAELAKIMGSNKGPRFKADMVEQLMDQFPEVAALMFDPATEEPVQEIKPQQKEPPVSPVSIESEPQDLDEKISRAANKVVVATKYPDWEKETASKEFSDWVYTLPAAKVREIFNSWDASVIIKTLDDFHEFLKPKKQQTENLRKDAVQPRGVPKAPLSTTVGPEEAARKAFEAEFYG